MLPWLLPQGSGNGSGNVRSNGKSRSSNSDGSDLYYHTGSNAQAPIYYYCSVLVVSLTLLIARMHNHIHLDSRHNHNDSSLLFRPILSITLDSLQHQLPQHIQRQRHRGWVTIAAMAIPALSKSIQAAPAGIHEYAMLKRAIVSPEAGASAGGGYDHSATATVTYPPPPPPPGLTVSPVHLRPSPTTTKFTVTANGGNPISMSPDNSGYITPPHQIQPTAITTTTTISPASTTSNSAHHSPENEVDRNPGATLNLIDKTPVSTLILIIFGSIIALLTLVLFVFAVVRWRRRRRVQQELDFGGEGAYTGNASVNTGAGARGSGIGGKRQKKTEHHVGLRSFGSAASSMIGVASSPAFGTGSVTSTTSTMVAVAVTVPAAVAKGKKSAPMTQFWNP